MRNSSLLKRTKVLTIVCILPIILSSCKSTQTTYYSQRENYISVSGTISSIKYNENSSALYIEFSELSPVLDDSCFKIVEKNLQIAQANKIDYKLQVGKRIDFITAPKYFGDGYIMPIVAISIDGENLLNFEDGYKNLLDWLSGT